MRANIYHIQNYSKSKDKSDLQSIKLKYIKSDVIKNHFPNFIYEKYAKKVKDLTLMLRKNYILLLHAKGRDPPIEY